MKIKYFSSILLVLFVGCQSIKSPFHSNNRYIKDFYGLYYNDSLKISIDFFGDYTALNQSVVKRNEFNSCVNFIKKNYPDLKIKKENFIIKLKTEVEPWIHCTLFYTSQNNTIQDTMLQSSYNNIILFTKKDIENKRTYFLVFNLDKQYKSNNLFDLLKAESSNIFSTLTIDENYNKSHPKSPFAIAASAFIEDSANYIKPIKSLEDKKSNYKTEQEKNIWLQAVLTYNSFIKNNSQWEFYLSEFYHPQDNTINSSIYDDDAFNFLTEQIKGQQLVIMNEQHWQPKHRYLGNLLLKYLYEEGFRYLAVEAIYGDNEQSLINKRKYPLQSSGFYTKEPTLGNFIRNALQIGFNVITYDTDSNDRERVQANTIYKKTFRNDPNAKVFVWCGIGHILENERESPSMAYYLKKVSGIDPLTIQQTSGDFKSKFLGSHYLAIDADTMFRQGSDIYIYNNIKENNIDVQPNKEHRTITVPVSDNLREKIKQHGQILLMIYDKDEFKIHGFDAVPILNYLMESNVSPSIKLPKGEFLLIKRSPSGFIIEQNDLAVD
ncbi:hypothetical protein OCV73_12655 [Barnesiella propionica]|uniref:hypothetical protein n=1 Tax=Barnesiella propionica TaxID=2981781 RepID=UPI0011CCB7C7|nr:hypothetical protein [Barnesiella propionica]MCU6769790.1 hypothetical protein [Barnesiella propionica]